MTAPLTPVQRKELSAYTSRYAGPGNAAAMGTYANPTDVIRQLAPDYPVHCFCPAELQRRVDIFVDNFPGRVGYAIKANGEALIIQRLLNTRLGFFDAASIQEIDLVHGLDAEATIFYDNPVKSREEIRQAYFNYGVRSFALDDTREFDKIHSVIGGDPSVQLTVRFKIGGNYAVQDLNTKFGAKPDCAAALLTRIRDHGYRPALTFHPGSQCYTPQAYSDYIYAAAMIVEKAGVDIVMLNVGGGFPVQYEDSGVAPVTEFFEAIDLKFRRYFANSGCQLVCEPGRALVASCGALVCRVKHRRDDNTIFLNDGIYGGFMEQLVSFFRLPTQVYRDRDLIEDNREDFKVYGPTCDSSDCFTTSIRLPACIDEDDWIVFGLTGAYGSATTTHFNGYSSDRYVIVEAIS